MMMDDDFEQYPKILWWEDNERIMKFQSENEIKKTDKHVNITNIIFRNVNYKIWCGIPVKGRTQSKLHQWKVGLGQK